MPTLTQEEFQQLTQMSEEELLRGFYSESRDSSVPLEAFPPSIDEIRDKYLAWQEKN